MAMTPPVSPSARSIPSSSSLHPPSAYKATSHSLLRRASGALRGGGGGPSSPSKIESPIKSTSSPTSISFNQDQQNSSNTNNNTLGRRLSLTFRRPSKSSLDGNEASPTSRSISNSNSISSASVDSASKQSPFTVHRKDVESNPDYSVNDSRDASSQSIQSRPSFPPPASPSSTNFNNHLSPSSSTNHNANFLSPKAATLLLSPEERAFRGGLQQSTSSTTLQIQPTSSYHAHLSPEECAFRGIPYVPIPSSPNSALANLATGGIPSTQREGKWERFRNAVSNSKGRSDKDRDREDANGNGLGLRGFIRSSSPIPKSPSQSPELVRNQLPPTSMVKNSSSKAEKLLGITSPTMPPSSSSKADKLLGISSPSTSHFNTMPSKVGMGIGGARSRATSSASRITTNDPIEMQRNKTEPIYSTYQKGSHPYLESQTTDSNRNRSGSNASSFFAENSSNASSSSNFLGLGLSHTTDSETNPYNSEQDSTSHSDFLNLGKEGEGGASASGVALGLYNGNESDSTNSSSSPRERDRTPSAEWGTFFPSLSKKESKDRLRESKEREKEKERERMRQLMKLKERRKEHERRLERNYEDNDSDGLEIAGKGIKSQGISKITSSSRRPSSATDYKRDPVLSTPPPSSWNQGSPISPVKSKKEKQPKTSSRVHAADLMAQFNLEKSPPKRKVKTHAKTRSSSSIERFETPIKKKEVLQLSHQRQNSTPRPNVGSTSPKTHLGKDSNESPLVQSESRSLGQYVAVQPPSHRKPVKGLFDSVESETAEKRPEDSRIVNLRPQMLSRTDSVTSKKRLSSLLCEGFDLVLDSDVDARLRAQEALQAIVDDDDARTCASSDFEGEDGIGNDLRNEGGEVVVGGGYVSAEEGEASPTRNTDEIGEELSSRDGISEVSPTAASFVTAPVKQKKLVSQKSPQERLLPLPPLSVPDLKSSHSTVSTSRALATLKSLPPLSSLVQECLSAESATASLKPKLWSNTSSNASSTFKTPKLLSSSSSKDQIPKSWIGYVRAYSRGEIDLSNPPKPRAAPIVSFPTPRISSSSPNVISPSLLGTGKSLRHQRSSSSFARFDGTFDKSTSPNLPSPSKEESQNQKSSSPIPIPFRNGAKTPPPMSSSTSPAFKSPRKSSSNSNLPRLSFASPSPTLDRLGPSYGASPMTRSSSDEKMRMLKDDEELIMREAEEVAAVGGEGDILAPRPFFEAERQESVRVYIEALQLNPDTRARSTNDSQQSSIPSMTKPIFDGLQLIASSLAQDLDIQCSGITLLDDSDAYLLASVGIESNPEISKGLGFKWKSEESRAVDPKLNRSPSGKQIVEGLGVEFEEEEREELVEVQPEHEELDDSDQSGSLPRDRLFDAHTILSKEGAPFVVSDTLADWRFERREGASELRFYAGVSILSPASGMPVGVVFVAQPSTRAGLKREEREKLITASKAAMQELESLRRAALKNRLAELDQSILDWANTSPSAPTPDQASTPQTPSPLLGLSTPMSPMTLAARRGKRAPQTLSVPPSPNPQSQNTSSTHPASSILQGAVNAIAQTLSGLVYIARVGSDPLACSLVVRSGSDQREEEKNVVKSEAAWRMQIENIKLKPDPAAHLCALAATKRGLSIHRDPTRVAELLGLLEPETEDPAASQVLSPLLIGPSSLESAMIVPAGLKEGGRMWRGTEGWVLGVALNSSRLQRLGPEVSIYLLRFASLLAPLLLEGPRSPSPLVVPPRSSSNHLNAGKVQKKQLPSKPNEPIAPLKSAPLPPLPLLASRHPYSNGHLKTEERKDLPIAPSRSPLLQTQPLSAPPSTNTFHPLPSPNGISSFSQRHRKAIPQASPPPSQPLPLPPLPPLPLPNSSLRM